VTKITSQAVADLGTELHRALSDPSRVQILELVREAEGYEAFMPAVAVGGGE